MEMREEANTDERPSNEPCCDRELTVEEICAKVRSDLKVPENEVTYAINKVQRQESAGLLKGPNVPADSKANQLANLTLAFRHIEDARMRLGKVMQAIQGGISILDRQCAKGSEA